MWARRTWHECADELATVSRRFRDAYVGRLEAGQAPTRGSRLENDMQSASVQGVEVLRALALAVRSEQDSTGLGRQDIAVGVLKARGATTTDALEVKSLGGYGGVIDAANFRPLKLRQALNKIAHADPHGSDYYVSPSGQDHDLILSGEYQGADWLAVISVVELINAIRSLPDQPMAHAQRR
jgi:hypothetical protein